MPNAKTSAMCRGFCILHLLKRFERPTRRGLGKSIFPIKVASSITNIRTMQRITASGVTGSRDPPKGGRAPYGARRCAEVVRIISGVPNAKTSAMCRGFCILHLLKQEVLFSETLCLQSVMVALCNHYFHIILILQKLP